MTFLVSFNDTIDNSWECFLWYDNHFNHSITTIRSNKLSLFFLFWWNGLFTKQPISILIIPDSFLPNNNYFFFWNRILCMNMNMNITKHNDVIWSSLLPHMEQSTNKRKVLWIMLLLFVNQQIHTYIYIIYIYIYMMDDITF